MARFLELSTGTSTTKTYVNLDEVAIVVLSHDTATFHFRSAAELKTTISALTPESYEKLRQLFKLAV
jgi:hypothetical protein